tara:strand:- start:593 stop:1180 length:588 start_codon:yes stop_codon:yes gene_type:complete
LEKKSIRKSYFKKRKELSNSKFQEESEQIIKNMITLIKNFSPKCVHCFLPIKTKYEIDTLPIIKYCWYNNIDVLIPVSDFEKGTIKSAEFNPNTKMIQTKNNITEPFDPIWKKLNNIDLVITPLLAFNIEGYRVGYGKGFYDRFFASFNHDVKRIGISLFKPCENIEKISKQDIPLTHCVTPKKIYSFRYFNPDI